MKRSLRLLLLFGCSLVEHHAQGVVRFENRGLSGVSGIYDAPVSLPNGTRASGAEFTAGLFLVNDSSLSLIATTPFRSGAAAGFFDHLPVPVPGVLPTFPATFRVRVWETAATSFENAVASGRYYGEFPTANPNNNIFIRRLGGLGSIDNIPSLDGILPFTLVPEPPPSVLFAVTSAVWLLRRGRRNARAGCRAKGKVSGNKVSYQRAAAPGVG